MEGATVFSTFLDWSVRYGLPLVFSALVILFLYKELWPWIRQHVDIWVETMYEERIKLANELTEERRLMREVFDQNNQALHNITSLLTELSATGTSLVKGQKELQSLSASTLAEVHSMREEQNAAKQVELLQKELGELRQKMEGQQ